MKGLSLGLSLTNSSGATAFSPISLSPAAWYDPSDLSTLWQDTAGTTPVTADGQSVARMDDKSGNGYHLTQATAANRPLYKVSGGVSWLEFDGSNDFLSVASAPAGSAFDRVSGIRPLTWVDSEILYSGGAYDCALIYAGGSPNLYLASGSSAGPVAAAVNSDAVVTERFAGASSRIAVDAGAYVTGNPGGNLASALSIGATAAGGVPSNFRFHGLVMKASFTDAETTALRTHFAAKQGRVL